MAAGATMKRNPDELETQVANRKHQLIQAIIEDTTTLARYNATQTLETTTHNPPGRV